MSSRRSCVARNAFPDIDVSDLHLVQPHAVIMMPFDGSGFSPSGIWVDFTADRGSCRNCKGTGIDQEVLKILQKHGASEKNYGGNHPCAYCDGSGKVFVGGLPPVYARVLAVGPLCQVIPWDVVLFKPYLYEEIELRDGRCFAYTFEQNLIGIVRGFDETLVVVEPPTKKEIA